RLQVGRPRRSAQLPGPRPGPRLPVSQRRCRRAREPPRPPAVQGPPFQGLEETVPMTMTTTDKSGQAEAHFRQRATNPRRRAAELLARADEADRQAQTFRERADAAEREAEVLDFRGADKRQRAQVTGNNAGAATEDAEAFRRRARDDERAAEQFAGRAF